MLFVFVYSSLNGEEHAIIMVFCLSKMFIWRGMVYLSFINVCIPLLWRYVITCVTVSNIQLLWKFCSAKDIFSKYVAANATFFSVLNLNQWLQIGPQTYWAFSSNLLQSRRLKMRCFLIWSNLIELFFSGFSIRHSPYVIEIGMFLRSIDMIVHSFSSLVILFFPQV